MRAQPNRRYLFILVTCLILLSLSILSLKPGLRDSVTEHIPVLHGGASSKTEHIPVVSDDTSSGKEHNPVLNDGVSSDAEHTPALDGEASSDAEKHEEAPPTEHEETPPKSGPPYRKPPRDPPTPIVDNFPLAAAAKSPSDLPPIPAWNTPPKPHVPDLTPLLIGFTRNWRVLQQTVVSYITAGWPREDIYIVENTGTMKSNRDGKLSLQNPFYLDYNRLTNIFGVNVISTPTLLSFAQLQNFYLHTALERNWTHYYWAHMDAPILPQEDWTEPGDHGTYKSPYLRAVDDLRHTLAPDYAVDEKGRTGRWAIKLYAFDYLTLMNVAAVEEVGGWDTQIPYYGTDCDMYQRFHIAGLKREDATVGQIFDVGSTLDDLLAFYRRKPSPSSSRGSNADLVERGRTSAFGEPDDRASEQWIRLRERLQTMHNDKNTDERGRNFWQAKQGGGQGEPYYKDGEGFERAIHLLVEQGKAIMAEKWGRWGCDELKELDIGLDDLWRVEHEWDRPENKEGEEKSE